MKPIKPLYVIILLIVIAAVALYGVMWYQKNQTNTTFANEANGQFMMRRFDDKGGQGGLGANGMTPVRGKIVSQRNNSIIVQLKDGSSKIVNVTGQTTINKTTTGTVSDLKSGDSVTALGTTNSDGSVTAQTILIGNGMMMFRRDGSPTGTQ